MLVCLWACGSSKLVNLSTLGLYKKDLLQLLSLDIFLASEIFQLRSHVIGAASCSSHQYTIRDLMFHIYTFHPSYESKSWYSLTSYFKALFLWLSKLVTISFLSWQSLFNHFLIFLSSIKYSFLILMICVLHLRWSIFLSWPLK